MGHHHSTVNMYSGKCLHICINFSSFSALSRGSWNNLCRETRVKCHKNLQQSVKDELFIIFVDCCKMHWGEIAHRVVSGKTKIFNRQLAHFVIILLNSKNARNCFLRIQIWCVSGEHELYLSHPTKTRWLAAVISCFFLQIHSNFNELQSVNMFSLVGGQFWIAKS